MSVSGFSLRRSKFGLRTMHVCNLWWWKSQLGRPAIAMRGLVCHQLWIHAWPSTFSDSEAEDFFTRIDLWVVGWWVESSCKTWHFLSAPAVMVFRSCEVNIDAARGIVLQGATLRWWPPWYIEGVPLPATLLILSTLIKLIEGITRKKAEEERELHSRIKRKCYRGNIYMYRYPIWGDHVWLKIGRGNIWASNRLISRLFYDECWGHNQLLILFKWRPGFFIEDG